MEDEAPPWSASHRFRRSLHVPTRVVSARIAPAGVANAILGSAFGVFLLTYTLGIWRQRQWAVPMAWVYAAYVPINLHPQDSPKVAVSSFRPGLRRRRARRLWSSAILLTPRRNRLT